MIKPKKAVNPDDCTASPLKVSVHEWESLFPTVVGYRRVQICRNCGTIRVSQRVTDHAGSLVEGWLGRSWYYIVPSAFVQEP